MKRFLLLLAMITGNLNLLAVTNLGKAQKYFNQGCVFLNTGKYAEALKQFNAALALDHGNSKIWDRRGTVYFSLHDYTSAISDYTRAIGLAPGIGFYYYERSLAYAAIGNTIAAMNDIIIAANFGEPEAIKVVTVIRAAKEAQGAAIIENAKRDLEINKEKTMRSIEERFGLKPRTTRG